MFAHPIALCFYLGFWKQSFQIVSILALWLITILIWWSCILISKFFQNHWLIQFIGFSGALSNGIGLISKAGKPRQQAVISASPVSSSQTEISAHFHLQMKIWEQERIISHSQPNKCPSTIHSFNHVVLNIYIAIQCSD